MVSRGHRVDSGSVLPWRGGGYFDVDLHTRHRAIVEFRRRSGYLQIVITILFGRHRWRAGLGEPQVRNQLLAAALGAVAARLLSSRRGHRARQCGRVLLAEE